MHQTGMIPRIFPLKPPAFKNSLGLHRVFHASMSSAITAIESAKRAAAHRAVDEQLSPSSHRVIGVGSGSTIVYMVERLKQRAAEFSQQIFIPTGFQSRQLIIDAGLRLGDIDQYPEIDVAIDGADEVDSGLNCIKGGGAAQLNEMIIARAAKKFVIIADSRKKSDRLGVKWVQGVPIEIIPNGHVRLLHTIKNGLKTAQPIAVTLRMGLPAKAGPAVTDHGNFVADVHFGPIEDPAALYRELKLLTGVVEVGLFCDMASAAYFGEEDGSVSMLKK
ncbi:uncharacterized protein VTP21DRAFT_2191 [Calcarisporiella thermophila]|uniref:uncharacterized protein n=1 Tax=Calcarisporiella thermophila TaxID=911321 RepID=UPI0037448E69